MKTKWIVSLVIIATISVSTAIGQGMGGNRFRGGMGGMMGDGWNYKPRGNVAPLTINEAATAIEKELTRWGNPDLELAEVMEFDNHFYAEVEENSTGIHAFEVLTNKYTGEIFPEPGPNMMWNIKYGHMIGGGMMRGNMSGYPRTPLGRETRNYDRFENQSMPIDPEKAITIAQEFLDFRMPDHKVDRRTDAFYGYYTIHILKAGNVVGMLSVNGSTGAVWYHDWHGRFVKMLSAEDHE